MALVADILAHPALRSAIHPLTASGDERQVLGVTVVEGLRAVDMTTTGHLLLLTRHESATIDRYRWDLLVRYAATCHATALGILREPGNDQLPASARSISDAAGITVFLLAPSTDLAEFVLTASAEVESGLAGWVRRAETALAALRVYTAGANPASEVADLLGAGLGFPVRLEPAKQSADIAVSIPEHPDVQLTVPRTGTLADPVLELVLHCAANAAGQAVSDARRAADIPVATNAAILAELIHGDAEDAGGLLARARRAGMAIDGWHTVVSIDLANLAQLADGNEVARHLLITEAARQALVTIRVTSGRWYRADSAGSITLVRMDHAEPAATGPRAVVNAATLVVQRLSEQFPKLQMYCGIGGTYRGREGLQTSAIEAGAGAKAAQTSRRPNQPTLFRSLGFSRSLLQWYSMGTSRALMERLLAPLDELGKKRRADSITTLRSYFDHPNSPAAAAAELGVHRNTMGNRIKRLFDLLDLDETNAEHRLMLQLACRMPHFGD